MRGRVNCACVCVLYSFLFEADTQTLVLTGQLEEPEIKDDPFINEVTLILYKSSPSFSLRVEVLECVQWWLVNQFWLDYTGQR